MVELSLKHRRVLVVEDEYFLADELRTELLDARAVVIGPFASVDLAMEQIEREKVIDGAILDVNLGGELVYPVADALLERRIPFVFATGYDLSAIPNRFDKVTRCEKPVNMAVVSAAIGKAATDVG